jgi:hypothetical protein
LIEQEHGIKNQDDSFEYDEEDEPERPSITFDLNRYFGDHRMLRISEKI